MKLLLIEDDMHIAKFLVNGFREEAITVTHATNGIDGLYEAQTAEFDVIYCPVL